MILFDVLKSTMKLIRKWELFIAYASNNNSIMLKNNYFSCFFAEFFYSSKSFDGDLASALKLICDDRQFNPRYCLVV